MVSRGRTARRGYGSRWRKYSEQYRVRHPLCRPCEEMHRLTPVHAVDHILPHRGDAELFWNPRNHQPICEKCHAHKSSRESRGLVIDWTAVPGRVVICGEEQEACDVAEMTGSAVWDEARQAESLGYLTRGFRPQSQIDDLKHRRQAFIDSHDKVAVVVADVEPAFRLAKDTRARFIHVWNRS